MFTLQKLDFNTASDGEFAAMNAIANRRISEVLPDDPPTPLQDTIRTYQNIPPVITIHHWLAWSEDGRVAGEASAELLDMEENQHLAQGRLYVDPACRRQGLGRQLLLEVLQCAAENGRRVFITEGYDRVPAGSSFAAAFGGEMGLAVRINQLDLEQLDRSLLASWLQRGQQVSGEYELIFWDGPYPESDLQEMSAVTWAMNQAPHDNLDVADMQLTPEILRQIEQQMLARGQSRWTFVVRHKASGHLAGFTDTIWNPSKPQLLYQGNTGVLEAYRGHGLGRWLKAAMLEKVIRERPYVRFIRTGNAASNIPMLKINDELGFKLYGVIENYQFDIPAALAKLSMG